MPSAHKSVRIAKISNLKLEGIIKKISKWATPLWVGRRKEPILGYVSKNYEKKNSGTKGLTEAIIKMNGYLELTVVYDMSYYVKLSSLPIKTIPRALTFFVLQISVFLCGMQYLIYWSNLT